MDDTGQSADAWFQRGHALHHRPWAWRKAADAYRRAILLGRPEAALHLGVLLQPRHRCKDEAKAAYEAAADNSDDEVAAAAALKLGMMLEVLEADHAGAQRWYAVAQARGTGKTREWATMNLGLSLAALGQQDAARAMTRTGMRDRYERWGLDAGRDAGTVFARRMTTIATFPPTAYVLRRCRTGFYRLRRVRRRLLPAGAIGTLRYIATRRGS